MERSSILHESVAYQSDAFTPFGHHDVAVLGEPSAPRATAVHPEGETERTRPCGPVTTGNILQLLEYQHHRCALTGRLLTPETASLDHIVPVRCGGEHVLENAQVLHKDVNRAKTTMTNGEFIQLCREVVNHTSSEIEGERL